MMASPGASDDEHNPENTGFDCVICEEPNHEDGHMVFCEKCQCLFHLACAGVSEADKDVSYTCRKCGGPEQAANQDGETGDGETVVNVSDSVDDKVPDDANPSVHNKPLGQQKQDDAEEQHLRELVQMQEEFDQRLRREQEKRMLMLQLERQMLEQKLAIEAEFNQKRNELYEEFKFSTPNVAGNSEKQDNKTPVKHPDVKTGKSGEIKKNAEASAEASRAETSSAEAPETIAMSATPTPSASEAGAASEAFKPKTTSSEANSTNTIFGTRK